MDIAKSTARIEKDLEALKQFTSTKGCGCTRMPFSPEFRKAADYMIAAMTDAGMEVWEDCAGNVFGRIRGKDSSKPCVMMGSHIDSVYNGGDYDGIAGVVTAVEVGRLIKEEGLELEADFVAAGFMDEEGCRFGNGYFGSKCMLGEMTEHETMTFKDRDGITIAEAMRSYNLKPSNIGSCKWPEGSIGHYLELHIEQGPVLDAKKIQLGLVDCIVGIQRYMITVNGRADHAGTTPMDMRIDAMDMAANVVAKIPGFAREQGHGAVATTGYIKATPGGMNVIAQSVEFSVDIRCTEQEIINDITANIKKSLEEETARMGGSYTMEQKLFVTPCKMSAHMLDILEDSCKAHGYSYLRLPSGAGHDALAIGQTIDTVMLFVPSVNARSHCPEEFTPYENFGQAVSVMFDLLKAL